MLRLRSALTLSGSAELTVEALPNGLMEKFSILITNPIHNDAVLLLNKDFNVVEKNSTSVDELKNLIPQFDAVITRSETAVTKAVIDAGKRLKLIARAGIGVDNIDVAYAREKGIVVINAPLGNAKGAAEHTVGLMFALARNTLQADRDLRKGIWGKQKYIGYQLEGKTVGIVGFGNVGKEVGRITRGIGMKIVVYDPFIDKPKNIRFVSFNTLLKLSDFVTLHVPLTKLTEGMLGQEQLSLMKPTAFLINCARGRVIDEDTVVRALQKRKIAGAAFDVFSIEPLSGTHPFLKLDNVIVTPHLGGATYEAKRATGIEIAEKVKAVLLRGIQAGVSNGDSLWEGYDTVVFDCDSTLCAIEGIDELAKMRGVARAVTKLTKKAMNGELPFEAVFEKRLALIKPRKEDLQHVAKLYIDSLIPDAKAAIDMLKKLGKRIILISGGYAQALYSLATYLGIDRKNVFANTLFFDAHGIYKGFDRTNPLWRQNGKEAILKNIKGNDRMLFVGDGAIDLHVERAVALFVGFGGVQKRAHVQKNSHIYILKPVFSPLIPLAAGKKITTVLEQGIVKQGIDQFLDPECVAGGQEYKKPLRQFLKE